VNHGAAGIYTPPDGALPADGVVAIGAMDVAQWVFGTVDLALTARLRGNGSVLNWRDWPEQPGLAAIPPIEVVSLRPVP